MTARLLARGQPRSSDESMTITREPSSSCLSNCCGLFCSGAIGALVGGVLVLLCLHHLNAGNLGVRTTFACPPCERTAANKCPQVQAPVPLSTPTPPQPCLVGSRSIATRQRLPLPQPPYPLRCRHHPLPCRRTFDAVSTPSHGKFRIATTAAARFAVLCAHLLDSFNTKHANDHSHCVKADNVHITEITYTTSLSCSAVALSASAPGAHSSLTTCMILYRHHLPHIRSRFHHHSYRRLFRS